MFRCAELAKNIFNSMETPIPSNFFFTNYGDGPIDIKPNHPGDIANDQYGNSWAADSELNWRQIAFFPTGNASLWGIKTEVASFSLDSHQKPSCKCQYCGCTNDHIYGTCDYCGAPLEG